MTGLVRKWACSARASSKRANSTNAMVITRCGQEKIRVEADSLGRSGPIAREFARPELQIANAEIAPEPMWIGELASMRGRGPKATAIIQSASARIVIEPAISSKWYFNDIKQCGRVAMLACAPFAGRAGSLERTV